MTIVTAGREPKDGRVSWWFVATTPGMETFRRSGHAATLEAADHEIATAEAQHAHWKDAHR